MQPSNDKAHKVFMCMPGVQRVQTATEEFIKRGEELCIKKRKKTEAKQEKSLGLAEGGGKNK